MDKESLKTGAVWLGAGSGVGVPAFSFFSSFPPPLFPGISIITAAISSAFLFIAYKWSPKPTKSDNVFPKIVKMGGLFIFISIPFLIIYMFLFQLTTIQFPNNYSGRLQIGFAKCEWSLSQNALDWLSVEPSLTVNKLVEKEGYSQDRMSILWKTWSIYLAGFLLICVYFLVFILWTIGFALLAKQRSLSEKT